MSLFIRVGVADDPQPANLILRTGSAMAVNREMSSELTDTGRETDVIGLGCSREAFTEHGEVLDLITKLYQFNYEVGVVNCCI